MQVKPRAQSVHTVFKTLPGVWTVVCVLQKQVELEKKSCGMVRERKLDWKLTLSADS